MARICVAFFTINTTIPYNTSIFLVTQVLFLTINVNDKKTCIVACMVSIS